MSNGIEVKCETCGAAITACSEWSNTTQSIDTRIYVECGHEPSDEVEEKIVDQALEAYSEAAAALH